MADSEFLNALDLMSGEHIKTSSYKSSSNDQLESFPSFLVSGLRRVCINSSKFCA